MKPFIPFLRLFVRRGVLIVIDADGERHVFGRPGRNTDTVVMRLHDPHLHYRIAMRPSLAIGEAFMDGTLTLGEETTLYRLLNLLMNNLAETTDDGLIGFVSRVSRFLGRMKAFNPLGAAQRNVAHHYDLGDKLFELFLDEDRQYSCAFFADPNDTLEQAQANKKEIIARKLLLRPGQRVLDIGSGWGGLGLTLAEKYGVYVTGITLSKDQLAASNARAHRAGLADHCAFKFRDYRREPGHYHRIVSVGMFEHVGLRHYKRFFRCVEDLLEDDGVALIHSIGFFDKPGPPPAWVTKYIFPGGYVPTLAQALNAVQATHLKVTDIEIWRLHYAETLRHWRARFLANRERAKALYDERFCRMWEFYLTSAEIGFRIGDLMVFQLQLAKRQDAVPLTRDYLYADPAHAAGSERRQAAIYH